LEQAFKRSDLFAVNGIRNLMSRPRRAPNVKLKGQGLAVQFLQYAWTEARSYKNCDFRGSCALPFEQAVFAGRPIAFATTGQDVIDLADALQMLNRAQAVRHFVKSAMERHVNVGNRFEQAAHRIKIDFAAANESGH
jgi:hypothetical protein